MQAYSRCFAYSWTGSATSLNSTLKVGNWIMNRWIFNIISVFSYSPNPGYIHWTSPWHQILNYSFWLELKASFHLLLREIFHRIPYTFSSLHMKGYCWEPAISIGFKHCSGLDDIELSWLGCFQTFATTRDPGTKEPSIESKFRKSAPSLPSGGAMSLNWSTLCWMGQSGSQLT